MKAKKLKELKKKFTADEIKEKYMKGEIFLTMNQLDKICKDGNHHGGCILKGKQNVIC